MGYKQTVISQDTKNMQTKVVRSESVETNISS